MDTVERELKVVPATADLLDCLATVSRLGRFTARGTRHELQRNSFFDSSSRSLEAVRVGFRRRTVSGARVATWTIKGDARQVGGVSTRSEIELALDADMPPALALSTLRSAARSRGAVALAEAVEDALASGGLPLARAYLETETDRRIMDLVAPETGWEIELALDRVRLLGHAYREVEIEAELKRGPESALSEIRVAIGDLGRITDSEGSKLSRAVAHIRTCTCEPAKR